LTFNLLETLPTTLEEALSAIPPPNPPAKIIKKPSDFKTLQNGRKAYWDDKSKTMVITNPKDLDGGTIFKPSSGKKYFDKQL
jgi:hypothetical protein